PPPPSSTLFPYTTLFRSGVLDGGGRKKEAQVHPGAVNGTTCAAVVPARPPPYPPPSRTRGPREIRGSRGVGMGRVKRGDALRREDRKSTRLNSSHDQISY